MATREMKWAIGLILLSPVALFSAMQEPLHYRPEPIKMPVFDRPEPAIAWREDLMNVPDYPAPIVIIEQQEPAKEPATRFVTPIYKCHYHSISRPDGWFEWQYRPCKETP